jgi:hypothetical protein
MIQHTLVLTTPKKITIPSAGVLDLLWIDFIESNQCWLLWCCIRYGADYDTQANLIHQHTSLFIFQILKFYYNTALNEDNIMILHLYAAINTTEITVDEKEIYI